MKKSYLLVLTIAVVFFVAGCACCKSKHKTCPIMGTMKADDMAKPAEVVAPAANVEEAAKPTAEAVHAVVQNTEVPASI